MRKKIIIGIMICMCPLFLLAQKKTLLKVELPFGLAFDNTSHAHDDPFSVFFPTLYVPVHPHIDLGISYNPRSVDYYVREGDGPDYSNYQFYTGSIKYKITSLYLKFNASASQRRINPFIGYIFSISKGTYNSPVRDSAGHFFISDSEPNSHNYLIRMTPAEEARLKEVLGKSKISHGVQIGIDFRVLSSLSILFKATTFAAQSYSQGGTKELAFPLVYKSEGTGYFLRTPQTYLLAAAIIHFKGGKKTLIR